MKQITVNGSSLGLGGYLGAHKFTIVKLKSSLLASVKCSVQPKIHKVKISVKLHVPGYSKLGLSQSTSLENNEPLKYDIDYDLIILATQTFKENAKCILQRIHG